MKRNLIIIAIACVLYSVIFAQAKQAALETAATCQGQPASELEGWGHLTYIPCHR